jgi:hypothetical protein
LAIPSVNIIISTQKEPLLCTVNQREVFD